MSALEARFKLYSSEVEIRKDQEAAVEETIHGDDAFEYLQDNAGLIAIVKEGCVAGIIDGISRYMQRKGIKEIDAVFDPHRNYADFYYSKDVEEGIAAKLSSSEKLLKELCSSRENSLYECEHIAEKVSLTYKDIVNTRLIQPGNLDRRGQETTQP